MKVRRIDFSPDEWIAGTIGMRPEDEGLYIRICVLIWSRGGRITVDLLKRSTNAHGNQVLASLRRLEEAGKIIRKGSEIGQKRAEKELENARKRAGKARENGAKGGRPKGLVKPDGFSSRKANHQPSTINHQKKEKKEDSSTRGAEFDVWYAAYPLHVGRREAEKAYQRARKLASAEELLAGIERYRSGKPDYADWSHPATWLNKGRWQDEYQAKQSSVDSISGHTEPWQQRLASIGKGRRWMTELWGPPPGEAGCRVPREFLVYLNGAAPPAGRAH